MVLAAEVVDMLGGASVFASKLIFHNMSFLHPRIILDTLSACSLPSSL